MSRNTYRGVPTHILVTLAITTIIFIVKNRVKYSFSRKKTKQLDDIFKRKKR